MSPLVCSSALQVSVELRDAALEAQAHYSLAQTYTLMSEPRAALAEHQAHAEIAARLGDRVGLLRASACLASLYLGASASANALHISARPARPPGHILLLECSPRFARPPPRALFIWQSLALPSNPPITARLLSSRQFCSVATRS